VLKFRKIGKYFLEKLRNKVMDCSKICFSYLKHLQQGFWLLRIFLWAALSSGPKLLPFGNDLAAYTTHG